MLMNAARMAIRALLRHRMRTALTALGISIGIASVMATVALGEGGTSAVQAQLDSIGENFLYIRAGSVSAGGVRSGFGNRRSLKVEDAVAIQGQVPEIAACSPVVNGREQMIIGSRNWNTRYQGVSPEFFAIRDWQVATGSTFGDYEVQHHSKVVVLGSTVAQELFDTDDPVGQTIRMGRFPFQVIGVLRSRGADRSGENQDDAVVMPYSTAQKSLSGITWANEIICSAADPKTSDIALAKVTSLLRLRHNIGPGDDDDFNIRRPEDFLTLRLQSSETLAFMLAAVGLVSLVVGGIGIMNIMLVSVAERTREIGLRLAIGARETDIRIQFLTEAIMLGLVGAVIGVAMGFAAAHVLTVSLGWRTVLSVQAVAIAVVFAVAAGFIFGYFPASRAASLTPIDALRND